MIIIPAIDILDGKCVRLLKGNYNDVTVYGDNAVAVAQNLEKAGATRIHIVDLDGARGGTNNRSVIAKIREKTSSILEVGGGLRTEEDVKELSAIGIDRFILGTVFVKEPDMCMKWIEKYGYGKQKFIAGIDALNGEVKISGWEKGSNLKDIDLAVKAKEAGFCSIIYTNIAKDGTLTGPDTERSCLMGEASSLPVIISGGISCDKDFKDITNSSRCNSSGKIAGIITGKAFYEGKFDLETVIKNYQKSFSGDIVF